MTNASLSQLLNPCGLLVQWANKIQDRYDYPVYLIGSAIWKEKPRDIDVCCIVPDHEFCKRYRIKDGIEKHVVNKINGNWGPAHWVWSADIIKRVYEGWGMVKQNLDFKVISEFEFKQQGYQDKQKILLSAKQD